MVWIKFWKKKKETHLPTEVAYADDVDFVSTIKHKDIRQVQEILAKYNLLVNEEKTEYTKIKRESKKEEESWRKVKKVGSLLGDEEDIERRKKASDSGHEQNGQNLDKNR